MYIHERVANSADIPTMKALYRTTLRGVNIADYSDEEIEDWVSCGEDNKHWEELLATCHFVIAEAPDEKMAGFASMRDDGYLHSMFVGKDYQRMGVGSTLLARLERYATERDIHFVTTEASRTALPFFLAQGYRIKKKQMRRANRRYLENYVMQKELTTNQ